MTPYEMSQKPSTYVHLDVDMFRLALAASGLSRGQLADKCRTGRSTISEWHAARGKKRVSRRTLTCVAATLGVPLDRLRQASTRFYPGCGPEDVHPFVGDSLNPVVASEYVVDQKVIAHYVVDDNWIPHYTDVEYDRSANLGWPSAYHVVWAVLSEAFLWAYHRDLTEGQVAAQQFNEALLRCFRGSQDAVDRRIVLVLQREMSATWAEHESLARPVGSWVGGGVPLTPSPEYLRLTVAQRKSAPKNVRDLFAFLKRQEADLAEFARARAGELRRRSGAWIHGNAPIDYSWVAELFWRNLPGPGSPDDRVRRQEALARAGFYDE